MASARLRDHGDIDAITLTHLCNTLQKIHGCENDHFQMKNLIFFLFLLKTLIVGTR